MSFMGIGKKMTKNKKSSWKPFREAVLSDEIKKKLIDASEFVPSRLFANNRFQVAVYIQDGKNTMQLSIKRLSGLRMTWADLQRIKNEICGFESEAVELFPAESRNQKDATETQLWVLPNRLKWPIGFGLPDPKEESEESN